MGGGRYLRSLFWFVVGVLLTFAIITTVDQNEAEAIPGYEPTQEERLTYERALALQWAKYNLDEPVFAESICD